MEDRDKFCEGCTLYERYSSTDQECRYLYKLENGEKCPCIDCLVKISCEVPCDEFDTYTYKSDKEKEERR